MELPAALRDLPGQIVAPSVARAAGHRERSVDALFEQHRAENHAYCRTVTALYSLYRATYGDAEAEYLALPADSSTRDLLIRRRELKLREQDLLAQVSTALRLGPAAADRALNTAIGLIERIPKIFVLIGEGVISPRAAQEALARSRVLFAPQVREFDDQLAQRLSTNQSELLAIPALRDAADAIVLSIDPAAAERRRQRAREDRTVTFRPEDDGMAAAYALLVAEDAHEVSTRIHEATGTVCAKDPRSASQLRADALVMLVRGFAGIGCRCGDERCTLASPRPAGDGADSAAMVRYRTMIHVVVNERTLADPTNAEPAYLHGHGPITAEHAREIASRPESVLRPFGNRVAGSEAVDGSVGAASDDPPTEPNDAAAPLVTAHGASGYRASADLARYLTLVYPRCVFPMCSRAAAQCQLDHSREYDHLAPSSGGATTADNLQPLCTAHHQLKTAGGWIDTRLPDGRILWTSPEGRHFIVAPSDTSARLFPDLARVQWQAPRSAAVDPVPEPPAPAPPTRIQREHARRQQIRTTTLETLDRLRGVCAHSDENRQARVGDGTRAESGGQVASGEEFARNGGSEFERAICTAITVFTQRRRAAARQAPPKPKFPSVPTPPREPPPPQPDSPPPPF